MNKCSAGVARKAAEEISLQTGKGWFSFFTKMFPLTFSAVIYYPIAAFPSVMALSDTANGCVLVERLLLCSFIIKHSTSV